VVQALTPGLEETQENVEIQRLRIITDCSCNGWFPLFSFYDDLGLWQILYIWIQCMDIGCRNNNNSCYTGF